jgi:hypothetical protein
MCSRDFYDCGRNVEQHIHGGQPLAESQLRLVCCRYVRNLDRATMQGEAMTAVTKLLGEAQPRREYQPFRDNLSNNPIKILTLQDMLRDLYAKTRSTVASSDPHQRPN